MPSIRRRLAAGPGFGGVAVPDGQRVAGGQRAAAHRQAHQANAGKGDAQPQPISKKIMDAKIPIPMPDQVDVPKYDDGIIF